MNEKKKLSPVSLQAHELLTAIAKGIAVEHFDKFQIGITEFQSSTTINVQPHDDDYGKVCGTGGVMIRALQLMFRILGNRHGIKMRLILGKPFPSTGGIVPKPNFIEAENWNNEPLRLLALAICRAIFVKPVTVCAADAGDTTTIEIVPMFGDPMLVAVSEIESALTPIFHAIGKAQGRNEIYCDVVGTNANAA